MEIGERQERIFGCLNAAVNLYGVVSFAEAMKLYNRYSADKPAPVGGLLQEAEIDAVLALPPPDDLDVLAPERWFAAIEVDGTRYLVATYGFGVPEGDEDEYGPPEEEGVRDQIADFAVPDLKILPEEEFFLYEEPEAFEETGVTKRLARFLHREYGFGKQAAEFAVWDIQGELRMGPSMRIALISARNTVGLAVYDRDEFEDLVDELTPLVRNTRAWNYRGHTETELVNDGVFTDFRPLDGEDVFDLFMRDNEDSQEEGEDEGWQEGDEEEPTYEGGNELSDEDLERIMPKPELVGPFDFKKVKDSAWREKTLAAYQAVRNCTGNFVRNVLIREVTEAERKAAAKRLGFDLTGAPSHLKANLDMVAGDYAALMDDQSETPPFARIRARLPKMHKFDQLCAAYYERYRYAWLVVEAVKAGFGLKCRDLLTGEELFLMETSMSLTPQVKGMTVCAGIAPMGEVYLALGVISSAAFDPPEAVHRIVRQHLGLPLDGSLSLSFADRARFAAETIRRIHAAGRYDNVSYGALDL